VNADVANRRVAELTEQRDQVATQIESIKNKMFAAQDVHHLIEDVRSFCEELGRTLRSDQPDERQIAARRCIHSIRIDRPSKTATVALRNVPTTVLGENGAASTSIELSLKR